MSEKSSQEKTCIENFKFPKDFLWGVATSAHQVEGNTNNNWTEWEKKNAERLAKEAYGRFGHLPNWKDIEAEATDPDNYISGRACDHYNRYREDFDIAKELGHNAHRFSIEWSRIEPEEGKFDEKEIEHYRQVLTALRERGMEPFVSLWHWTFPVWLAQEGGLSNPKFPTYFERYTEKIAKEVGSYVNFWVTLNEPDVVASQSYILGAWPPQKKNLFIYYCALKNLIKAHKLAYVVIKKINPNAKAGIAKHQISFELARKTFINFFLKTIGHYFWNRWFLNSIRNYQDFIGLNHYNRNVINNGFNKNPNKKLTDFGWEFYPESIYQALIELKSYHKPIYITENGIADAKDNMRKEFVERALASVSRAIGDGIHVEGYFYWSLLDNFEWDKGFWPRFGLIEINYETLERKIRPSALIFRDIIKNQSV
jgi:beta-glucosidase